MPANETLFQQAMNQGHSAAWDQDWTGAANFYRQALAEIPDNVQALTSLGLALFQLQDYRGAILQYRRSSELIPEDPMPLEKIAESFERLGMPEQSVDVLMRVADLYARSQDFNRATESWAAVVRVRPDHLLAHSRLALVFERLGRKPQAVSEYLAIAGLLQHTGEVQKAIQAVQRALQVAPDSRDAGQALAMLQAGQRLPRPQKTQAAPATYPIGLPPPEQPLATAREEPSQAGPDPIAETRQKALSELAGILFEEEDQEVQATRRGLAAIVTGHGSAPVAVDRTKIMLHLSQVIDLQGRGQNAKALDELERAVDLGLDHAAAQFDLGWLLSEANRLESSTRILQKAVKHPDFALGARLVLAQAYQKMGRPKEAAVEYLEGLRLADIQLVPAEQADELGQMYDPLIESQISQPADVQAKLCENIANFVMRADWRSHLTQARKQIPSHAPGSPPMPLAEIIAETRGGQVVESMTKIQQLASSGHYRTAMEEAYRAITFAPTYLPLHMTMADLLQQDGHQPEAIAKYTAVARGYNARGAANRAIDVYRRIIDISPMDMESRRHLIEMMIARGQTDTALSEYLKLAEVYYNLADLGSMRQTYTEALRLAQQTNVSKAWKVKVLHRMADLEMQSLDWRQALRIYEQIRNLQPDDEASRTSLIGLNLRLGLVPQAMAELDGFVAHLLENKQYDAALQFVETLVNENPKQAALYRRLAELYRRAGRTEDAIARLDTAGNLLMDAGDKAGAIEVVMAILALNPPNTAEYQQILAKLQAG
jgi:tetratricopeptide (TPR) repeat protein